MTEPTQNGETEVTLKQTLIREAGILVSWAGNLSHNLKNTSNFQDPDVIQGIQSITSILTAKLQKIENSLQRESEILISFNNESAAENAQTGSIPKFSSTAAFQNTQEPGLEKKPVFDNSIFQKMLEEKENLVLQLEDLKYNYGCLEKEYMELRRQNSQLIGSRTALKQQNGCFGEFEVKYEDEISRLREQILRLGETLGHLREEVRDDRINIESKNRRIKELEHKLASVRIAACG